MANRRNKPPKPPAQAPGAPPPLPPTPPEPTSNTQPPVDPAAPPVIPPVTPPDPAATTPKPTGKGKTRRYLVNWLMQGFRKDDLKAGDTVDCTEAEAAPYLGGVLSLDEDEA